MTQPFLLGITGGIGSGKSVVCKVLQTMNIPTYDADSQAKALMNENPTLKAAITQAFGADSYQNGQLNREYLAQTVFNDEEKLQQLNALVHPAVKEDFEAWVDKHKDFPMVVKEAALLFETGSYKSLDKTILVSAPEQLRIERVLTRDPQRTEEQVRAIMQKQWPEDKKKELADVIIENDERQLLIPQVIHTLSTFKP